MTATMPTGAPVPGIPTSGPAPGAPSGPPPPPSSSSAAERRGWTGGRIVSVVFGAVLVLTSLGLLTGGAGTLIVNSTMRDGGYITSLQRDVSSAGYAVVVDDVVLEAPGPDSVLPARLIGDVRVRADGAAAVPVFVGIARSSDVDAYLGGVQRDVLHHMVGRSDHGGMMGDRWSRRWVRDHTDDWAPTVSQPGTAPAGPPTAQGFWAEQASGAGEQSIVWTPREGSWALVVMNADGSRTVGATVDVGATVPWLPWLGAGLLLLGVVAAVAGALLVLVPIQRVSRDR